MIDIKQSGIINDHKWVDLGLSVKWATCNVGASLPSDCGSHFAWGETVPKNEFSWKNYKFRVSGEYSKATFNKYITRCDQKQSEFVLTSQFSWVNMSSDSNTQNNEQGLIDNKVRLELSDDAARVNWSGTWRMPTREELDELITKCDWERDNRDKVYRVTSKINGNSIVLPYDCGRMCYWSSSLRAEEPFKAYGIEFGYSPTFESDMIGWTTESRCNGLPVRPVSD